MGTAWVCLRGGSAARLTAAIARPTRWRHPRGCWRSQRRASAVLAEWRAVVPAE
jgi:hypothetical protein